MVEYEVRQRKLPGIEEAIRFLKKADECYLNWSYLDSLKNITAAERCLDLAKMNINSELNKELRKFKKNK